MHKLLLSLQGSLLWVCKVLSGGSAVWQRRRTTGNVDDDPSAVDAVFNCLKK